jgi:GNAT superfamily N-acetyltransferase
MGNDFRIEPQKTEGPNLKQVADFLNETFSVSKFTESYLNWQYLGNPDGRVVGFNFVTKSNEIAAHYSLIPIRANLHGKERTGLLSLNTATSRKFQGRGLFTRLASHAFEVAASLGYSFVVGVGNQNSTHGFVNKLGFKKLSELEVRLGFFWGGAPENDSQAFQRVWNADSLRWRLNCPLSTFSRTCSGFIVRNQTHSGFLPILTTKTGNYGIASALSEQKLLSVCPMVWIGTPMAEPKNGFSFFLSRAFRPSPLNFIFFKLQSEIQEPEYNNTFFEALDFDVY